MSKWSRRDFLKSGLAASGAPSLLPAAAEGLAKQTPNTTAQAAGRMGSPAGSNSARERLLFDFGWRFHLGHANDPGEDFDYGLGGAYQKTGRFFLPSRSDFDDHNWRPIDLPHDWAVELPFQDDPRLAVHGSKPLGREFPRTSIGWYRRVFQIPREDLRKRLSLEFDGVFRNSMVALNGNLLGRNMSGYAPFRHDISDYAFYGGKKVLVVRVDATEFEGWFYEGAGIYRHVWLVKTSPVHVPQWGTFVTSEVAGSSATVSIATEVANESDDNTACVVVSEVQDDSGKTVASTRSKPVEIKAWRHRSLKQKVAVSNPRLWSVEKPWIYRLLTAIEVKGKTVDRMETPFGIRTIRFDADNGFFLNGERVELMGTCNHQDHAGVGTALPDRIQQYRIERLKDMGSNALRTSHNPPTPEMLDACDRLGMLVLDETRMFSSDPEGLSQLRGLILRDRNHPSVVFWSTGNEEPEQGTPRGARMCATMKRLAHRLDPMRPITQAMDGGWGKGISTVVDVQGFNYNLRDMDPFHQKFPQKPCVGTEVASTVSTRGIYVNDAVKGYGAYGMNPPPWASTAQEWWQMYDAHRWLAGGFVWTGFDYRGEPTHYGWPCISSHFGILDTCGFAKDVFYYYRSWWTHHPVLHLFPHWNWTERKGRERIVDVWCFSNLEKVELLLNGKSLGVRTMERNSHVEWKVKYAPGTLEARGYRGDKLVLTDKRETMGPAVKILLRPDRDRIGGDGEDVSIVAVRVVDAQGRFVPVADNLVMFTVSGPGKVIGVGNGDPSCHEPDKASQRSAFNGLCCVIVQSEKQEGEITLQASSPGLESAAVVIGAESATPHPAVA